MNLGCLDTGVHIGINKESRAIKTADSLLLVVANTEHLFTTDQLGLARGDGLVSG